MPLETDLLLLAASAGLLLLGGGLATVAAARRNRQESPSPRPIRSPMRVRREARDAAIVEGIRLAVEMARVDGEVHATEMNAIHDFLTTHVKKRDVPWAAKMMRAALEDARDADRVSGSVAALASMSSDRTALVIRLLAWVARADGRIHDAEREFLGRVGLAIGVPDDEIERLIATDAPGPGADDDPEDDAEG